MTFEKLLPAPTVAVPTVFVVSFDDCTFASASLVAAIACSAFSLSVAAMRSEAAAESSVIFFP